MVKVFETQGDLDNEQQVIERLKKKWGGDYIKLDRRYHVDFMISVGGLAVCWLEIKCYTYPMDKYPTAILELDKAMNMSRMSLDTGLPSLLVLRYSCGNICFTRMERPFAVRYTGKNDRYDMAGSPCAVIPMGDFAILGDDNEFQRS
jgi:hypothetical protein